MDETKIPGEMVYDKTKFSYPPAREEAKLSMVYDRTQFRKDPNLKLAEGAGRAVAQSMKAEPRADGYEMIFIPRQPDEIYDSSDPGEQRLRRHEAPAYIGEQIVKASETGNFLKTLEHYEQFLESVSDEIDPKTMEQIRSLFSEGKNVNAEGRKEFVKKVSDFVKTISYTEF